MIDTFSTRIKANFLLYLRRLQHYIWVTSVRIYMH